MEDRIYIEKLTAKYRKMAIGLYGYEKMVDYLIANNGIYFNEKGKEVFTKKVINKYIWLVLNSLNIYKS